MLAIVCFTAVDEPLPISIIVMTAPTPMMMPRVVNTERMTLRRSALTAMRMVRYIFFMDQSPDRAGATAGRGTSAA